MRKEHENTPIIQDGRLYTDDEYTGLRVGSAEWFVWLELGRTFYLTEPGITFRCEARRKGMFWYAFKRCEGKLHKVYAGKAAALSADGLEAVASRF